MLDWIVLGVGGFAMAAWLGVLAATVRAMRRLQRMSDIAIPDREWPSVTLVRPACNEALRLEAATRQALALDYDHLDIVLIDDRSTDETPAIVDRLAADDRVAGIHVETLPPGWLGKVHALQRGVEQAHGDWLLFADADSHFESSSLKRAIAWADACDVDFVSVIPGVERAGFLADAAFSAANHFFAVGTSPWRISEDDTTIAATGAFMLVRRAAFERTPGFEWLRLEVADDFGLCLMVKQHGGKAGLLVAPDSVRLTWYENFGEMTRLMQKNFFAITGRFSLPRCLGLAAALTTLAIAPFLPLLLRDGLASLMVASVAIGAGVLNGVLVARWTGRPLLSAILPWVGLLLTAFIVVRSAIVGVRAGGIVWRGVLYRTEELRDAQRVKL